MDIWKKKIQEYDYSKNTKQKCLHEQCSKCKGTGHDTLGKLCIHMLSCPCPKCIPRCYSL